MSHYAFLGNQNYPEILSMGYGLTHLHLQNAWEIQSPDDSWDGRVSVVEHKKSFYNLLFNICNTIQYAHVMVSNSAFCADICKIDLFFQYIQLMGKVNNSLFFMRLSTVRCWKKL